MRTRYDTERGTERGLGKYAEGKTCKGNEK
jgi:hypothetical protein